MEGMWVQEINHLVSATAFRIISRKYALRTIEGGIGHDISQEAPEGFAKAILNVGSY